MPYSIPVDTDVERAAPCFAVRIAPTGAEARRTPTIAGIGVCEARAPGGAFSLSESDVKGLRVHFRPESSGIPKGFRSIAVSSRRWLAEFSERLVNRSGCGVWGNGTEKVQLPENMSSHEESEKKNRIPA